MGLRGRELSAATPERRGESPCLFFFFLQVGSLHRLGGLRCQGLYWPSGPGYLTGQGSQDWVRSKGRLREAPTVCRGLKEEGAEPQSPSRTRGKPTMTFLSRLSQHARSCRMRTPGAPPVAWTTQRWTWTHKFEMTGFSSQVVWPPK